MTNRKQESLTFIAGEAFGSGFHESTQVALFAMDALKNRKYDWILDMGCGSGVLSLVAAHWWPEARILAVDIEPKAVETTRLNAEAAGLERRISTLRSDGFAERAIEGAFDLIICNMVAEPIIRLAPGMAKHAGGTVILSGILNWLLPQVTEVYGAARFQVEQGFAVGDWRAVVLGIGH